jgi:hypothetical protein
VIESVALAIISLLVVIDAAHGPHIVGRYPCRGFGSPLKCVLGASGRPDPVSRLHLSTGAFRIAFSSLHLPMTWCVDTLSKVCTALLSKVHKILYYRHGIFKCAFLPAYGLGGPCRCNAKNRMQPLLVTSQMVWDQFQRAPVILSTVDRCSAAASRCIRASRGSLPAVDVQESVCSVDRPTCIAICPCVHS